MPYCKISVFCAKVLLILSRIEIEDLAPSAYLIGAFGLIFGKYNGATAAVEDQPGGAAFDCGSQFSTRSGTSVCVALGLQGELCFLVGFEGEVQEVADIQGAGLGSVGQTDFVLRTGRADFALGDGRDTRAEVDEAVAFKNLRGGDFIDR